MGTSRTGSFLISRVAETTAHRDRDALDSSIVSIIQEIVDARSVAIYRLVNQQGLREPEPRAFILQGQTPRVNARNDDAIALPMRAHPSTLFECIARRDCVRCERGARLVTLFPLGERGPLLTVVEVVSESPLSERDARVIRGVLRIMENQVDLLDYGERDTLTGLLNRKTFEARIHKLAASLRASSTGDDESEPSCWLGLLDIDRFKLLNDHYGHLFGDEVLLLVSQIMKRTFRGADELFRFGGEEFVILLSNVGREGSNIAFERLRGAVEAHKFPQSAQVTVSLGYTRLTRQDVPTTCIERADAALYYAKNNGRNNVRLYEALVEAGAIAASDKEGEVELF